MEKVVQSSVVEDSLVAKVVLQPASLRLGKHTKQLQLKLLSDTLNEEINIQLIVQVLHACAVVSMTAAASQGPQELPK